MFSLKTAAFSVFVMSVVSLASASPLSHLPRDDDLPPVNMQAMFCTDMNYSGTCHTDTWKNEYQCINVQKPLNDKASSFQALDPHLKCFLFRDSGCSGPSVTVDEGTGGVSNLNPKPWKFNDRMSSYYCESVFSSEDSGTDDTAEPQSLND